MIIREKDLVISRQPTEVEITKARADVDRWQELQKTTESPGWAVFVEYLKERLGISDSLSTCNEDNFLYRKGYCDGLRESLQVPAIFKQKATSASELLRAGLDSTKES